MLITAEHLGICGRREASGDSERSAPPSSTAGIVPSQPPRVESLAELEKRAIADALAGANGNKSRAAAAMVLTRFQLYARLKRFALTEQPSLAASAAPHPPILCCRTVVVRLHTTDVCSHTHRSGSSIPA